MTEATIRELLDRRFGGVLKSGAHIENGEACALEAVSVLRGIKWTDSQSAVGMPDLRRLNDAHWPSDRARTEAMVPLLAALADWPTWSTERRVAWSKRIAERTISEILPIALREAGLEDAAKRCEAEGTKEAALDARAYAYAAYAYAAAATADASAAYAAYATRRRLEVLILACRIMREEALAGREEGL